MKYLHAAYVLSILLGATSSAHANSMVAYAWSEVAFTAESGTHVEASVDKQGNLTKLIVVKNGKTFRAPDSVLQKISDAVLNDIAIYEEPNFEQVTVKIKAGVYDPESGNLIKDITWSIRTVEGKLYNVEYQESPSK